MKLAFGIANVASTATVVCASAVSGTVGNLVSPAPWQLFKTVDATDAEIDIHWSGEAQDIDIVTLYNIGWSQASVQLRIRHCTTQPWDGAAVVADEVMPGTPTYSVTPGVPLPSDFRRQLDIQVAASGVRTTRINLMNGSLPWSIGTAYVGKLHDCDHGAEMRDYNAEISPAAQTKRACTLGFKYLKPADQQALSNIAEAGAPILVVTDSDLGPREASGLYRPVDKLRQTHVDRSIDARAISLKLERL